MVHKEDLLEMFITYDLEDLYGDFSDDGDGELELTEKGNEVATTLIKLVEQEIDRAREEGRKERTDELKQAFHEVFYKSGELWFDYIFEDGDTKAEQEAKAVVEDYWDEIISKLRTK